MRKVLLTGMSGVGKSTVADRLRELGYKAIDTDYGGFSEVDDQGEQHWRVDRIRDLLGTEDTEVLFVVGTDRAQATLAAEFDHIILLSAPRAVMLERIAQRTNNPFGKTREQLAKIVSDTELYEPMIRERASHEIDTNRPLNDVIHDILTIVTAPR